jgi:hypothetical protein
VLFNFGIQAKSSPVTGNLGRPWFRYSVEEIFRKAVIARNGRRTKNTRCSFRCNWLILGEVARTERFELTAFWFVGRQAKTSKWRYWYRLRANARLISPLSWTEICEVTRIMNKLVMVTALSNNSLLSASR